MIPLNSSEVYLVTEITFFDIAKPNFAAANPYTQVISLKKCSRSHFKVKIGNYCIF